MYWRFTILLSCVCLIGAASHSPAGEQEEHSAQVAMDDSKVAKADPKAPKDDPPTAKVTAPAWLNDARWYFIDVDRFRNGDRANDPDGTRPWLPKPHSGSPREAFLVSLEGRYGGDLAGIGEKLPYLQDLGVNTIILSPVWRVPPEPSDTAADVGLPSDFRHVDESFGVRGPAAGRTAEGLNPKTWKRTASDQLLIDLLAKARKAGIRVVLDAPFLHAAEGFWAWRDVVKNGKASKYADWFDVTGWEPLDWAQWDGRQSHGARFKRFDDGFAPALEEHIFAVSQWWMDPDGDGDPSDGVAGWRIPEFVDLPVAFVKRWRTRLHELNPDAVLVGTIERYARPKRPMDYFDVVMDGRFGDAIARFFAANSVNIKKRSIQRLFDDLDALGTDVHRHMPGTSIRGGGGRWHNGLLARLVYRGTRHSDGTPVYIQPDDTARALWRLATVFQHFYLGAPLTAYGEEVGMHPANPRYRESPMWWADLGTVVPDDYRSDFFALIRMLHTLRDTHAALRSGTYRTVLVDEKRHLLAFARTLPDSEVIVLMNLGNEKQRIELSVGRPGQLVGVLTPQLTPMTTRPSKNKGEVPKLLIGGSRQYVSDTGTIRLAVRPMAIRLVLVLEHVPGSATTKPAQRP